MSEKTLKITIGDIEIVANLKDTPTAQALYDAAPFTARASTWGEEVYFETPVAISAEPDARDVMQKGEIAFWPPGNAIALAYGRTPVSRGDEMRLASPSNVFAKTEQDLTVLASVRGGTDITVDKG